MEPSDVLKMVELDTDEAWQAITFKDLVQRILGLNRLNFFLKDKIPGYYGHANKSPSRLAFPIHRQNVRDNNSAWKDESVESCKSFITELMEYKSAANLKPFATAPVAAAAAAASAAPASLDSMEHCDQSLFILTNFFIQT